MRGLYPQLAVGEYNHYTFILGGGFEMKFLSGNFFLCACLFYCTERLTETLTFFGEAKASSFFSFYEAK